MKFGLTKEQYLFIEQTLVVPLSQKGATVWCFGSRARGTYQKYSDLDLMVESANDLSTEISEIQEKFTQSNFPLKVDLVQKQNFAESYMPNYLKERKQF